MLGETPQEDCGQGCHYHVTSRRTANGQSIKIQTCVRLDQQKKFGQFVHQWGWIDRLGQQ